MTHELVNQIKSERITGAVVEELEHFEKSLRKIENTANLDPNKYVFNKDRDVLNYYQTVKTEKQHRFKPENEYKKDKFKANKHEEQN